MTNRRKERRRGKFKKKLIFLRTNKSSFFGKMKSILYIFFKCFLLVKYMKIADTSDMIMLLCHKRESLEHEIVRNLDFSSIPEQGHFRDISIPEHMELFRGNS